ncbi:polyketide cyclase [Rhizobium sp. Leaf384]|uniref:SRPBCC family protein n=1 Tax=unclassified Rhizobium TaxID=2613769 RepID=UPI000712B333|nr:MULTISPECIES: SRPBCC family protein [unclassified Rhizobium]KQS79451.1 polyketide cyclase [Rhizobium sp. Leaf384]KQS85092.1 polyketide cyclase [Rhizobium sp. Leaf383]
MTQATAADDRDLVITRHIAATPNALFRCWTEPALIQQWFVPPPWTIAAAEVDLRVGGGNLIVMQSPEGEEMPNRGVYLEIVPDRKIVFTDAYIDAWTPSEKPFMTGIITFDPADGGTLYTARVRHWTKTDRDAHEQMGFHEGWGKCADQLAALAATLPGDDGRREQTVD